MARAQDIAFVRANNSLGGRGSADEEMMVSINDLIKEEGGEGEEDDLVEEPARGIVKGQLQWTGLWESLNAWGRPSVGNNPVHNSNSCMAVHVPFLTPIAGQHFYFWFK